MSDFWELATGIGGAGLSGAQSAGQLGGNVSKDMGLSEYFRMLQFKRQEQWRLEDQARTDEEKRQKKAEEEAAKPLTSLEAILARKVQTGELTLEKALGMKRPPSKDEKEKSPPDFAGNHRDMMREERSDFAKEGKLTGDFEPFPEKQKGREIFNKYIESQAAREGLDTDSIAELLGINRVTGAMDIPLNVPNSPYKPKEIPPGARFFKSPGQQSNIQSITQQLRQMYGVKWDQLSPEDQQLLIQDEMGSMK